jgi:hypothetical protein
MAIASRGKDDEDGGCCSDVKRPGRNVGGGFSSTMVETLARGGNENKDGGCSGNLGGGGGRDGGFGYLPE